MEHLKKTSGAVATVSISLNDSQNENSAKKQIKGSRYKPDADEETVFKPTQQSSYANSPALRKQATFLNTFNVIKEEETKTKRSSKSEKRKSIFTSTIQSSKKETPKF